MRETNNTKGTNNDNIRNDKRIEDNIGILKNYIKKEDQSPSKAPTSIFTFVYEIHIKNSKRKRLRCTASILVIVIALRVLIRVCKEVV